MAAGKLVLVARASGRRPNIRSLQRQVNRIKRGGFEEVQYHNSDDTVTPGTTGSMISLNLIAQGDTNLLREGNKIRVKSLAFRLDMVKTVATTDVVRVIIFKDMEQHGTKPVVADLLKTTATSSFLNTNTRQRFKVLRDLSFTFSADDAGNGDRMHKNGLIKFRRPINIHFVGTSASDSSMGKGSIYSFILAKENTTKSSIQLTTEMKFIDG